jgi:predicted metalloenzyme YecM
MLQNTIDLESVSKNQRDEFNAFCSDCNLVGKISADHIGLKCSSTELYEKQRLLFEFNSRFVYQSIISKRRISIIGLMEGLPTVAGNLNFLELSDQKPDGTQKDIVDHLEIVPTSISYEVLVSIIREKGYTLKETIKPHHSTYDVVLPSGFVVKLSREMLVDKIKRDELL